ncbi:hypothetical protein [Actinomadura geliboluensis]
MDRWSPWSRRAGCSSWSTPHIDWLAARSGSVAALGSAEVYKALGAGDNITY